MLSEYFLFLLLAHISVASCTAMPEIIVLNEGDNRTLNCSAEQGVIQWYKDGQPLMNNSQIVIYTDSEVFENFLITTSFLKLHGVGGDDTGNYSCQIMNQTGNSSVEFEIHVDFGRLHLIHVYGTTIFTKPNVSLQL